MLASPFGGLRSVWDDELDEPLFDTSSAVLGWPLRKARPTVKDKGDSYELQAEVPGVGEKDVKVSHKGQRLMVKAGDKLDEVYRMPRNAQLDKTEAKCENGVLTLTIPKMPKPEPKEVQVTEQIPSRPEGNEAYYLTVEVPGLSASDLKAVVESTEMGDMELVVRGQPNKGSGRINRSYAVPSDADTEKAEAGVENGLLGVKLPRKEAGSQMKVAKKEGEKKALKPHAQETDRDKERVLMREHMPGIKPESVSAEVHGNVLVVSAERNDESQGVKTYRSFTREATLPSDVDPSSLQVNVNRGVLEVTAPQKS